MPCRLKKCCRAFRRNLVPHPLVDPGNPTHRREASTTANPTRLCHYMVTLAPRPPGRSATRSSQKEKTTVMLGLTPWNTCTSYSLPACLAHSVLGHESLNWA